MATKSQLEIIQRFMKSLDTTNASGRSALNQAVKYASGGYFTTLSAAINKMLDECKSLGADKFLLQKCGINLSNADTGAITGYDAGGKKIKTAESVVPESGSLDTSFTGKSFTVSGVTFYISKNSLASNEAYIWQALKTWWAQEGLKLVEDSFGYSFNDTDAAYKKIKVVFESDAKSSWLAGVGIQNGVLTMKINKAVFKNFSSGDVNGKSSKYPIYLDMTIAHELTHAVMMAKVNNYDALPQFVTEGLAELTRGIDGMRADTIKSLAKNPTALKKNLSMATAGGGSAVYAAGYIFLRYLAKQGSENYAAEISDDVTLKSKTLTLAKNFSGTLDLNDYSSKIKTVKAGAVTQKIFIYGNDNDNSIIGGKGNDTLSGGKGNDTLAGGGGKNIFIYSEGNDVIADWADGDKISLTSAISKTKVSGADVVFTVGKGSLTVKDGKGKNLNVITSTGEKYSAVLGAKNVTLTNAAAYPVTVDSAAKNIDASARTTAIQITGNAKDNSIVGGTKNDTLDGGGGNDKIYGGKGNDILIGGSGNDSLWGEAGNDNFICGDGDDIIFGFEDGDTLTLDNINFKTSVSGKGGVVKFKFDEGSVTLKNFSAATFHVNDSLYEISDGKFRKK